jgi:3-oxoacyl-[acyl-carrier protein] reductase
MDLGLDGRVALVCGSSSGLGLAIATTLAEEGCRVALNGRDEARLEPALEQVRSIASDAAAAFAADVSVPAEVERLVGRVTEELGPIDIIVCNAGGPPPTTFSDAPADSWQEALELNLLSTIHLCRATVPGMRERRRGRVVCIASVAAKQPLGSLILSTTARAGVLGFAKFLADEVAADGVTVNTVCPGYTRTERVEVLLDELSAQRKLPREEIERGVVQDIPAGRMGTPEELAAAVTFLASDRASYITGVALQVDGGFIRSIV